MNDLAKSFDISFDTNSYLPIEITYHTPIGSIKYVYEIKNVNKNIDDKLFTVPSNVNVTVAPITAFKTWSDVISYLGKEIPHPTYTAGEKPKKIFFTSFGENMWMISAIYENFTLNVVYGEHPVQLRPNAITLKNGIKANYLESNGYRAIVFTIGDYNVLIKSTELSKEDLIKIASSLI